MPAFVETNVNAPAAWVLRMETRDDGKSVEQAVNALDVPYLAMGSSLDLLPQARRVANPPDSVWRDVEIYFDKYGIEPIKET